MKFQTPAFFVEVLNKIYTADIVSIQATHLEHRANDAFQLSRHDHQTLDGLLDVDQATLNYFEQAVESHCQKLALVLKEKRFKPPSTKRKNFSCGFL
jgi:hypothetical protein